LTNPPPLRDDGGAGLSVEAVGGATSPVRKKKIVEEEGEKRDVIKRERVEPQTMTFSVEGLMEI